MDTCGHAWTRADTRQSEGPVVRKRTSARHSECGGQLGVNVLAAAGGASRCRRVQTAAERKEQKHVTKEMEQQKHVTKEREQQTHVTKEREQINA